MGASVTVASGRRAEGADGREALAAAAGADAAFIIALKEALGAAPPPAAEAGLVPPPGAGPDLGGLSTASSKSSTCRSDGKGFVIQEVRAKAESHA